MHTWLRLMAAALALVLGVTLTHAGAARKPKVLFVHSVLSASESGDIVSKLQGAGVFQLVDVFNASSATPTLAQLKAYDAVLLTNQATWADRVALGNVMSQYVDAGYGVVQTTFTTGGVPDSTPGGSWSAAYNGIVFGPSTNGAATLGTIAVPNHATMIGVGSFIGGPLSYRPAGTTLTAGATLIASWSDGKPLVVVGPKINRADLGFYPPSSNANSVYWNASTDGTKLMVNALLYTIRPKVLLVHADVSLNPSDVQAKLRATELVGPVDLFDAGLGTPTPAQLQNYDAVLTWTNASYADATSLGNIMADYVDAGGGVVAAVFTNAELTPARRLQGRWISGGYEIIPGATGVVTGTTSLGPVIFSGHPIVSNVPSLNSGTSGWRPNTATLNAGGVKVALWADGRTLAAVSTKRANRADLGMFPPSSTVQPGAWVAGTNGDKLMANALVYVSKPYIACAHADPSFAADVQTKLIASRRFSGVALVNAQASTPLLATLSQYNAVMTWSNDSYFNSTALGNTLADYVDAGGAVVTAVFGNLNAPNAYTPSGRWVTQGYDIAPSAELTFQLNGPQTFLGTILEPANPMARFVRKFDGGSFSFRSSATPLLRGRAIMNWSDGRPLMSVHNFRKRTDLGYWPVSDTSSNGWNHLTDGTWMTANAIDYAVRHAPCPGDLNGDDFVDDTDFVKFAGYYNELLDARGDLNGDSLTDDADFVIFAAAYDNFLCP